MNQKGGKFLVEFVDSLGNSQVFFGFWLLVVVVFVVALMNYQKKASRRNFRETHRKPITKAPKSNFPAVISKETAPATQEKKTQPIRVRPKK